VHLRILSHALSVATVVRVRPLGWWLDLGLAVALVRPSDQQRQDAVGVTIIQGEREHELAIPDSTRSAWDRLYRGARRSCAG